MARKWGAGHAAAWLRAGPKELAQIIPAFPGSVRVVEEPGLAGNPTPQEVLDDKGKDGLYQEWLDSRTREAASEPELPDQGIER